jgi:hypothetical protein
MPCSCKLPIDKYPETADWGPLFWKLLHGLAEYTGKQKGEVLQGDEVRTWIRILNELQATLPCDVCSNHYGEWLQMRVPNTLKTLKYSETSDWIRNYLWALHNRINEGNDKPIFPFDSLAETYKGVDLTMAWQSLEPVMKRAITLNGISLFPWKKWLAYVRTLQGIYGAL